MKFWNIIKGVGLLVLLAGFVFLSPVQDIATSMHPERIGIFLSEAGSLAPVLFVILMAMSVIVSPIPSLPLDIAAGAFFGPFLGGLYSVIGALLGALARIMQER